MVDQSFTKTLGYSFPHIIYTLKAKIPRLCSTIHLLTLTTNLKGKEIKKKKER